MRLVDRNGLTLSAVTLGTVQLGLSYGVANRTGQPTLSQSRAIIETALRGGVRCLDTARGYGESEEVIGRCLKAIGGTERPVIVTKFTIPPGTDRRSIQDCVIRSVQTSLERIGVPCVDILMLHHAGDLLTWGDAIIDAAASILKAGYARKIGLSLGAEPEETFFRIWAYAKHPIFEAVQAPLNLLDQRLIRSGALQRMAEAGKIVFARSIYLQGLLLVDPERLPPHLAEAKPYMAEVRRMAAYEGMTVNALAAAYVRDLPGVDSMVMGAETAEQAEHNIRLASSPPLREETRRHIENLFMDVPGRIISPHLW